MTGSAFNFKLNFKFKSLSRLTQCNWALALAVAASGSGCASLPLTVQCSGTGRD